MKKLLSLALILCLLIPCAFAEDVSAMSDDEIAALYTAVRAEMISRFFNSGDVFPGGIYICGQNVKAGLSISCRCTDYTQIKIFASYDAFISGEKYISLYNLYEGDSFTVFFTEGVCWSISHDMVII